MKHESSVMDDLSRARLVNMIAMKNLLVRLLEALGTSAQAVWSKGRVHHQLSSLDSASFNPTISRSRDSGSR